MPDLDHIDEAIIQTVWNDQKFFDFNLMATDGRSIEVLKSGEWNHESEGPDFRNAEILINQKLCRGDVEIHVRSSEWYAHKHHLDQKYNRVILHAVFWNDDINLRTRLQNGDRVPTLELLRRIDIPIGELLDQQTSTEPEDAIDCQITGRSINPEKIADIFDQLGLERLFSKADSMRSLLIGMDFDQLLYEGIMEALGYEKNRKPFREVVQRLEYDRLRSAELIERQALLFGTSGLLPYQSSRSTMIAESEHNYVSELETIWQKFDLPKMEITEWSFGRIRPANSPTRRLAGASYIIDTDLLMHRFIKIIESANDDPKSIRDARNSLIESLTIQTDDYWRDHHDFGKPIRSMPTLIGNQRASEIVINIVLPIMLVWAENSHSRKLRSAILNVYDSHRKFPNNRITKQIDKQIFTTRQPIKTISPNAKRQQGMIWLNRNFCERKRCDDCPVIHGGGV